MEMPLKDKLKLLISPSVPSLTLRFTDFNNHIQAFKYVRAVNWTTYLFMESLVWSLFLDATPQINSICCI